ncbi:ubiquinone/menaquinone biosynthesis C-methyltransferase UbiE [Aspergillus lentulus]|nr:ubiquinone/menaquinone biosynthesis C-methyltransferase UbiE [Aspergillus lentulus]
MPDKPCLPPLTLPLQVPQQNILTVSASYERVTGSCTREVAQFLLTLQPTVDASSVVLDNACGTGIITEEILERFPTASKPKVYAADLASSMVSSLSTKAASKGWVNGEDGLVEASVMDAKELTFPYNMFTHSYTDLGILFFKIPEKGPSQIYRTLQPGGTAFLQPGRSWGTCRLCAGRRKLCGPTALLGNYR